MTGTQRSCHRPEEAKVTAWGPEWGPGKKEAKGILRKN